MDEDSSTNTYTTPDGKTTKLYPGFNVKLVVDENNAESKKLRIESNSNTARQQNVDIPDNVTNVRILRIDDVLYYSFDRGKFFKLNSYKNFTNTNNPFNSPVIFGAGIDPEGGYRRYFKGIISDASIKFISDEATIEDYNPPLITIYAHEGPIRFVPNSNGVPSRMIDTETGEDITDVYGNTDMIYTGFSAFKDAESLDKEFEISFVIEQIESDNTSQAVLVNAKYEKKGWLGVDWPGFVYRLSANGSTVELTARGHTSGSGTNNKSSVFNQPHKITIARRNRILYFAMDDATEKQVYNFTNFSSYFDVPITIGGSLDNDNGNTNQPFRGFKGTLSNIVVKVDGE